jgi:ubiquinone/menaquinone biosynthesis C-methylase UbiE
MNPPPPAEKSANSLGDFTNQASAYQASRPGYPQAILKQLIDHTNLSPGDSVADLGAGTGIFTELLAEYGLNISAIEPNAGMRAIAVPHQDVTWIDGTFNQTHLPDDSQDWIVAAQAFHWAEPTTALPEAHRILKRAGHFTVLWNNRLNNDAPTLAKTWAIIKHVVPDFDDNYRENDWAAVLTSTGHFTDVHTINIRHEIDMPKERFLNLWRSHNRLNTIAGPKRFAEIIEAIGSELDRADGQGVVVPYMCKSWTARREER